MTAKLWDPNSATLVASFSTIQPAHTLSMSPTQTLAAVGCDDCCIRLLDVSAGVATHTLMGANFMIRGTVFQLSIRDVSFWSSLSNVV